MNVATAWEASAEGRMFYRDREHQERQFQAVVDQLPPGPKSLLDVGSGYGDFTAWLPEGYTYRGVEANQDLVAAAHELYPGFEFDCTTELADADVIIAIASLQSELVPAEDLIRNMLKHAGLVILTTTVKRWPDLSAAELFPEPPDLVWLSPDDDFVLLVKEGNA